MTHLKAWHHAIPVSKFIIEHTIEGAPVCDVVSRVVKVIVAELKVHAEANIVKLFM